MNKSLQKGHKTPIEINVQAFHQPSEDMGPGTVNTYGTLASNSGAKTKVSHMPRVYEMGGSIYLHKGGSKSKMA